MNLFNISFIYPEAALLFSLIILFFILFWALFIYRLKVINKIALPQTLDQILIKRSSIIYWIKTVFISVIWVLAVLAIMQPQGISILKNKQNPLDTTVEVKSHLVIFLIDASASMSVKDSKQGLSRLDSAKDLVGQILRGLNGEEVALFAYTSDLTALSPQTTDYFFIRLMTKNIEINEGENPGSNLLNSLNEVQNRYLTKQFPIQKTLVIFSDGGDNTLDPLQKSNQLDTIQNIAQKLTNNGKDDLQVIAVGLGSTDGGEIPNVYSNSDKSVISSLNENVLKELALSTHGVYFNANEYTTSDLGKKIDDLIRTRSDKSVKQNQITNAQSTISYDFYYQIPLGIALLLFLFVMFFPERKNLFPFLILILVPLDLSSNDFEKAYALYQSGNKEASFNIYKHELGQERNILQKSLLNYNLAAVALDENNYENSASFFANSLNQNSSLLLKIKSLIGLGWNHYKYIDIPENSTDYEKIVLGLQKTYYLKLALREIDLAQELNCSSKTCLSDSPLNQIKNTIQNEQASLGMHMDSYYFSMMPTDRKFLLLDYKLNQLQEYSTVFDNVIKQNKDLSHSYLIYFEDQLHQFSKYFDNLDLTQLNENQIKIVNEITQIFTRKTIGKIKLQEVQTRLNDILKELKITEFFKESNFFLFYLDNYLSHSNLKIEPLNSLIKKIDKLGEDKEKFKDVIKALNKAKNYLKNEDPLLGRIYTEYSRFLIQNLIEKEQNKNEPSQILYQLIRRQFLLLNWNRLFQLNLKNIDKEINAMMLDIENDVILQANEFMPNVFKMQSRHFHNNDLTEGRCQKSPWNKVIPLFEKGLTSAKLYKDNVLEKNGSNTSQNEDSLKSWILAYGILNNKLSQQSKIDRNIYEEQPEAVLLEMEHLDESVKTPQNKINVPKPGVNPW